MFVELAANVEAMKPLKEIFFLCNNRELGIGTLFYRIAYLSRLEEHAELLFQEPLIESKTWRNLFDNREGFWP